MPAPDLNQAPVAYALYAPAKVNLVLRVLGKRPDGYHELDTLMVPISLCDEVRLRVWPSKETRILCRVEGDPSLDGSPKNLAFRAAEAFLANRSLSATVSIDLKKRIPHGAGLGGGSSDAAAVLKGLSRLFCPSLPARELHGLATGLGADVPFFLACRPAWAAGIGEILTPLTGFPRLNLAVVMPPVSVPTAWAYREALSGLTSRRAENNFPRLSFTDAALGRGFCNDFEPGVAKAYPDVARVKAVLESRDAQASVLSGSGAAVVGLFDGGRGAQRAVEAFRRPDRAWAVKVLRRRPQWRK